MYNSISELLQEAEQRKQPLWSVILKNEIELTDKNEMDIFDELEARYEVMLNSAFKGFIIRNVPGDDDWRLVKGTVGLQ